LIEVLIDSFDIRPEESAEAITATRRTEIAQRMADIKADKTRFIPADKAMRKLRTARRILPVASLSNWNTPYQF
jgi:putative addiction module component (TIGR02574 family)